MSDNEARRQAQLDRQRNERRIGAGSAYDQAWENADMHARAEVERNNQYADQARRRNQALFGDGQSYSRAVDDTARNVGSAVGEGIGEAGFFLFTNGWGYIITAFIILAVFSSLAYLGAEMAVRQFMPDLDYGLQVAAGGVVAALGALIALLVVLGVFKRNGWVGPGGVFLTLLIGFPIFFFGQSFVAGFAPWPFSGIIAGAAGLIAGGLVGMGWSGGARR